MGMSWRRLWKNAQKPFVFCGGNQGRSQAAPLAASRQRTRCRDRPQPQRTSRILRASQHSGTDAARTCPSALLASLPVKISQNNSIPKTLNRHKTNIRSKSELSKNTSICNNLLSKRILYQINEFCNQERKNCQQLPFFLPFFAKYCKNNTKISKKFFRSKHIKKSFINPIFPYFHFPYPIKKPYFMRV